ncbi:MAG TPA: PorV/PorQ family protein [Rhodothermales bacterium]|nr:PorV/PorQ family protein [Rhodothermales bacterium]
MKKILVFSCLLLVAVQYGPAAYAQGSNVQDHDKRAQSGLMFLDISMSPRAAAMGDAVSALDMNSSTAMFYNPASMATLEGGSIGLGTVQWSATDIQYNQASVAFSPSGGRYGVIGVSVQAADYGNLQGTIIDPDPESKGYIDIGNFSPTALAVGVGYARSLSDRFSVGGVIKYAHQSLGESQMDLEGNTKGNSVSTPVADFGVLYRTGFKSLNLAVTARNFSPAVTYEEESFEAPLSINIGLAMNVFDLVAPSLTSQSFLVSVEGGHPRSYDEQIRLGGEYRFMNLLSLRAGYAFPSDEQSISLGAGLNVDIGTIRLGADYAFTQFGDLGNMNRIGVNVGF